MRTKKVIALLLAGVMLAATALSGCGTEEIDKEATVLTVDGTEVSLGFANFVARYEQAQRDQFYVTYMGEDVWESDADGDGLTTEDTTKADIMTMIQSWFVLDGIKGDYGVEVSADMMAQITETAEQFMADNTEEAIAQLGATQEYVEAMLYYTVLESQIQEMIEAEATITVTDEDAKQRTFSYIMLSGVGETNEETGLYEAYDEATLAEKEKEAESAVERAKTDFDAVAEEFGYEDNTYSYGPDDATMDAAIIEAADGLKEGEISGLIKGTNGYFVIRLDSEYDKEASDKNKASLIEAERVAYYEGVVAELVEAADIVVDEKQWEKVKFDSLFTIATGEETTE